jgi:hypothetical protein
MISFQPTGVYISEGGREGEKWKINIFAQSVFSQNPVDGVMMVFILYIH